MRRGPGIGGIQRRTQAQKKMTNLGNELENLSLASMQNQLESFQRTLEEFAMKHKDKINNNPIFRAQFQKMCASIGVDPLASSKGMWAQSLGVGDFYYELAIQVIEMCLRTKGHNGGIIALTDLVNLIKDKRKNRLRIQLNTNKQQQQQQQQQHENEDNTEDPNDLGPDDVKLALEKINILGNGYRVMNIGGSEMVLSIPLELMTDHLDIIKAAKNPPNNLPVGCIDPKLAAKSLNWTETRAQRAIDTLVIEGLCWVDRQASKDHPQNADGFSSTTYWVPAVWLEHRQVESSDKL